VGNTIHKFELYRICIIFWVMRTR